ncbi:hypothetical protein [Streptomyces sp. NPDC047130]|uniref:hypothetical protein n=1 Tax=Streptomyces sp. NPDC047130 TaxID=3155261 RepID=UPI0033CCD6CC
MPDEHDRWLDRDTAERLLRGERLDAGAPAPARDLERVLDRLSAGPAVVRGRDAAADVVGGACGTGGACGAGETCGTGDARGTGGACGAGGEEAAVAAFRAARAVSPADVPGAPRPVRGRARGRGAARQRFVLAAVLVTGVVGGGAAIGGGLHALGSAERAPAGVAATAIPVPAGTSTPVPLGSETPGTGLPQDAASGLTGLTSAAPQDGGTNRGDRDHDDTGTAGTADRRDRDGGEASAGDGDRAGKQGRAASGSLRAVCRAYLAGRPLSAEQRRGLDTAAGEARLSAADYCARLVGEDRSPADGTVWRDDDQDDDRRGRPDDGERGGGHSDRGGSDRPLHRNDADTRDDRASGGGERDGRGDGDRGAGGGDRDRRDHHRTGASGR